MKLAVSTSRRSTVDLEIMSLSKGGGGIQKTSRLLASPTQALRGHRYVACNEPLCDTLLMESSNTKSNSGIITGADKSPLRLNITDFG